MPAETCAFCRIVEGRNPASIVYRDPHVVAFRDIHPVAPIHILIIPVKHVASLQEVESGDDALLARLLGVAKQLAVAERLVEPGYRLVMNTGAGAGQSIFHLHLHLLGGRQMHWPPG